MVVDVTGVEKFKTRLGFACSFCLQSFIISSANEVLTLFLTGVLLLLKDDNSGNIDSDDVVTNSGPLN